MPLIAPPRRLQSENSATHGTVEEALPQFREVLPSSRPVETEPPAIQVPREIGSLEQWSQVVLATLLVAGSPIMIVWWLRASGTLASAPLCMVLALALSLGISQCGRLLWEKRPGSEDLLFSELMLWGYLHRLVSQRRLASALATLGPMSDGPRSDISGLSTSERAKLLERLVAVIETRDPYLHGHSRRVARHSWMIARRLGLSRAEVARVRTAAAIHDVGKIKTPKQILHKPSALNDAEYEVIKQHPGDGAAMAATLRDPAITSMVRHHHERLDGTGYPDRLASEAIPLGARIIAVADTFDAITSRRPYRAASAHKRALDILKEEAGTRLDPDVVRAFCGHYAGRRPLALWSFAADLPERLTSWLGGSAASVGSAAKTLGVAALVGGVAATSHPLGLSPPTQLPSPTLVRSTSASRTHSSGVNAPALNHAAALARQSSRLVRSANNGRRSRAQVPGAGGAAEAKSLATGDVVAAGAAGSATVDSSASNESGVSSAGSQESATTTPASPAKSSQESSAAGKSEEAHVKAVEAHGKSEVAHAKSEEAHATSEEAHAKVEEAHSKVEEAPGKVEEAAGGATHPKAPVEPKEKPKGIVEEVIGKTKEILGKLG